MHRPLANAPVLPHTPAKLAAMSINVLYDDVKTSNAAGPTSNAVFLAHCENK